MYKKVIDILMSSDEYTFYRNLVIQIAKDNPSSVINAHNKLNGPVDIFTEEQRNLYNTLNISEEMFKIFVDKYGKYNWFGTIMSYMFYSGDTYPQKIKAIKEIRQCTGSGLKEAKNFIDSFQAFEFPNLPVW